MKILNPKILKNFVRVAGDLLDGEWVILGGTILPLLGVFYRITTDIDIASISSSKTNDQTLALIEISQKLGLPIETINQAGKYYLEKIEGFRKDLILLHKGLKSTIYRPNCSLFIRLKIERFSEADYLDCIEYLKLTNKTEEKYNKQELIESIKKVLKKNRNTHKAKRLNQLCQYLGKC